MSEAKKGEVIHGKLEHAGPDGEIMFDMQWNWYMGDSNAQANSVLRDTISAIVEKSKEWSDAKNAGTPPKGATR